MNWSPGKLMIVRWDLGHLTAEEPAFRIQLDTHFYLKKTYSLKKGKYLFISLYLLKIFTDLGEVSEFAGRINYRINSTDKIPDTDLLMLLAERTHHLFVEEFEKRKKASRWKQFEIPEFDPLLIKDKLKRIICE